VVGLSTGDGHIPHYCDPTQYFAYVPADKFRELTWELNNMKERMKKMEVSMSLNKLYPTIYSLLNCTQTMICHIL